MSDLGYGGKRVAVTGVSSGIGEATARLLGELGASVTGLDVNPPRVDLANFVAFDLCDGPSIAEAAATIEGPLDVLIHCAGLPQTAPGLDVFLSGFVGPRELTERLLPHMAPGGAVVCVASTAGYSWPSRVELLRELLATSGFDEARAWCSEHLGTDGENYALTKGAVSAYAADRSFTLGRAGIRINCVSPGPTETPMTEAFRRAHPELMDRLALPLGRTARPDEQAWVFAFLGSDRASFVTGSTVYVDGGYVAALTMGNALR